MDRPSDRPRGSSPAAPIVVGRAEEQVFLCEELTAAFGGRGRLVLLGGEAGIGKTTLARALVRQAVEGGACVLAGHCYDLTNTPPYGPWLDLVAGYRPTGDLPVPPRALAGGKLEGVTSQAALFADVRLFVEAMVARRPVLLVLEDLHWADPASLELLRYIAPFVRTWPLLLLATYRVDELTRRHPFYQQLPALVREAEGLRLDLRRLEAEALAALVSLRYTLPDAEAARLVDYLERHAEGNPFFATELLRTLEDDRLLRSEDDGWRLAALDRVVMPTLVHQVIDARVARLGEETRQPLAVAAVIGQEVPLDLWAMVAGLDDEAALTIVEQAVEAHLLEAERDGTRVRFVHALTREALYEGVLPPRRRVWHRLVAEALATESNADPDAVAYHFQEARDPRAVDWLIRAGERAQRAYACLTAVERLQAAAELLAGVAGEERLRSWLLLRLARLRRFSSPAEGVAAVEEAERLAHLIGDGFLLADARYSRGLLLCYADDFGRGVELMREGIAFHEARLDAAEHAPGPTELWLADALPAALPERFARADDGGAALRALGMHHRRGSLPWFRGAAGHLVEAVRDGERFIALVETAGPTGGLVLSATGHAHHGLGTVLASLGRPEEARRAFARTRDIYGVLDHHGVIAFSYLTELRDVVIPYLTDDPAERRRLAAEAEASLHRAGGAFLPDVSPRLGWLSCLTLDGDWDKALRIIDEMPPPGNAILRREVTGTLAYLAYHRGDAERASAQIAALLPDGPATPPGSRILHEALFLQRLAADLCLDAGDLAGARAWLEAHDGWLSWSGAVLGRADGRLAWTRWYRVAGDPRRAHDSATEAVALARAPHQPLALLAAHRLLGETEPNRANAERHLATALALADDCEAPFERALTLLAVAEARIAADHAAKAETPLAEARAICVSLGARTALARAEALAERLTRHPPTIHPAGLTDREVQVLRFVAQGLTDAAVGERLFISPRTVSQHLRSIYGKLGVSSRAAATRFAVEHGLG